MKKGKGKNHPSPSMSNALGNLQHVRTSSLHVKLSNPRECVPFSLAALFVFTEKKQMHMEKLLRNWVFFVWADWTLEWCLDWNWFFFNAN